MDKEKYINSTKFIYDTLEPVLDKRAEYLKSLYYSISPRTSLGSTYLDIGAGTTSNGKVFGKSFKEVIILDLNNIELSLEDYKRGIKFIQGDARNLPFENNSMDLVTLISIIEHIPHPWVALGEAKKVTRSKGEIVIQVPSIFFPIDLHTGVLNPFWFPRSIRKFYTTLMGFPNYTNEVFSLPTKKDLVRWIEEYNIKLIGYRKVIYPTNFVPPILRPIYWILLKVGILNLIPLGHLYVFRKQ